MNDLTHNQLAAMILISDAFALFCFSGSISLVTSAVFIGGVLFQLLLALPLSKLGGVHAKWAEYIYLVYVLLWGGMLFVMQWKTSRAIYIPYENSDGLWGKLLISGIIAAVCLYITSAGVKALARSALIAAFIGAVCLAVVTISALVNMDVENFKRAESDRSISEEITAVFALGGGIGSFAVMLGLTKGNALRSTMIYFVSKAILTAVVALTAVIVAGGIMKISDFPVVTAAQLSQPFSSQRIDSLFLMVFTIFAVFSIAVQSTAASLILKKLFPKFTKFRSTATLLLMLCAAFILSGTERYGIVVGAASLVMLFAVPIAELLLRRGTPDGKETEK